MSEQESTVIENMKDKLVKISQSTSRNATDASLKRLMIYVEAVVYELDKIRRHLTKGEEDD